MNIAIPELSLVVLIGASGSGKSTFARAHFKPTEVLSSDYCRGLVSDDENDQAASEDAFDVLHYIAAKRLAAGRLVVVDATNVQPESRRPLVELARRHHVLPVALVFNLPERLCQERNATRPNRDFGPHVVRRQTQQLRRSLHGLQREGFRQVAVLHSPEQVAIATVERTRLWTNKQDEHGPFDLIGDVHGCYDELIALLSGLGYAEAGAMGNGQSAMGRPPADVAEPLDTPDSAPIADCPLPIAPAFRHAEGRTAVFLGDLVDRGPKTPEVLRLVIGMVAAGSALSVPGNHESKLLRKLQGRNVQVTHGLAESLAQLDAEPQAFRKEVTAFLDGLVSHYVLDDGRLVVAHAGMKAEMQGRASQRVRDFALYGETTGETDEFGLPVRYNWAAEYRGQAYVVYGHTPTPEPEWLNRTICLDTGCVFGGRLTALRYPEMELVSVPAARTYYEPSKPFLPPEQQAPALSAQQQHDDVPDLADVLGKRIVNTRLIPQITIREENAIAALEVMSRFAVDPKWLIYLPPTMSPVATSIEPDLLEHPAQAFAYYRAEGVPRVVCEEKHMGSRAVVVLCRDPEAARRRFGVSSGEAGAIVTRTGRPFFTDQTLGVEFLGVLRDAVAAAGLWEELETNWLCLDCELLPWSAKAQELLRGQYAAVGAAARSSLSAALTALEASAARGLDVAPLLERVRARQGMAADYVEAYRRYCWPVASLADLRLAPFHLLASEGAVHTDKDHRWHMAIASRLVEAAAPPVGATHASPNASPASSPTASPNRSPAAPPNPQPRARHASPLQGTAWIEVDVTDPASEAEAVRWWTELTARGGEGMVVKPLDFVVRGPRGLTQPAVKVRGREYLRIIYGPEYTEPANLQRLRQRGLGLKRSLAAREFALGVEALERFVRREPFRRVHECVFGVLAMESEPVDPRL